MIEERRTFGGLEPAGVAEEVSVPGEGGFLFGVEDGEEVVGLGEGEFKMDEGEDGGELMERVAAEGADGVVAGEKLVELGEVDEGAGGLGWLVDAEPLDDVALDGGGQVVEGAGAVGEAEVDDGGDLGLGAGGGPGEVGGVCVVVGPEGGEVAGEGMAALPGGVLGEWRAGQGLEEGIEGLFGGCAPLAGAEPCLELGACGEAGLDGPVGIGSGEDGEAGDEGMPGACGRGVSLSCVVELSEGLAGAVGVGGVEERGPGERVLIGIDAGGEGMGFVGPVAVEDGGCAVGGGQGRLDEGGAYGQPSHEGVLFGEGSGGAYGEGVALEEDFALGGGDEAGGGEWARADGEKLIGTAGGRVEAEDAVCFGQGEGRPVRGDQVAGEAVRDVWVG